MAGLVPAIHVLICGKKDVDARITGPRRASAAESRSGHDEVVRFQSSPPAMASVVPVTAAASAVQR
jgi:hypothetical protein